MSIVKNTNTENTDVTIKRLLKDTATTIGSYSHYFRLYHQFNNKYAQMDFEVSPGQSVFIKCEIEEHAEGYIYGYASGANIYVKNSNGEHKIQWRNGSSEVFSIPWDNKIHVLGWVGYIPDAASVLDRACMPFYDAVTKSASEFRVSASGIGGRARIGSAIGWSYGINSSASWAIRVYEVQAKTTEVNGETTMRDYHYYAAVSSTSAASGYFVNTRYSFGLATFTSGTAISGITASDSAVNFPDNVPGYGVQLHDIRLICASGYNDTIPIVTEDGGLDEDAGFEADGTAAGQADYPSSLTQDTDVRKFAFSLNGMPRPSGWSYSEFTPTIQGGYNYPVGELHHGRKPKWSIWNDAIDFGFMVNENGYMVFNVRKRMDGVNYDGGPSYCRTKFCGAIIEGFENYNTDVSCFHAPFIRFTDDTLAVNIHNGAMLRTQKEDTAAGDITHYSIYGRTATDAELIYNLNESLGGKVSYRLGNLAPWNRTYEDMEDVGWIPIGVKLALTLTEQSSQVFVETKEHKETAEPYLTSGASDAVKNEYRRDGWTEDLVPTSDPERKWRLLDYIMNYDESNPMPLWAKMSMITGVAAINNSIDCSYLVAPKKCSMYPVYEPKIGGGSGASERDENWDSDQLSWREGWVNAAFPNYRMVMVPEGNLSLCNVYGCDFTTNFNDDTYSVVPKTRFEYSAGSGDGLTIFTTLSLPILGCTVNSSGAITALDSAATDYMGVVELYYYGDGAYKYAAAIKQSITKATLETPFTQGMDYKDWYGPSAASTWIGNDPLNPYALWKNGQRQWGYYSSASASEILDIPQDCNVDAHNSDSGHLYDKVRFIAVNGYDFAIPRVAGNRAIPKDSTAVVHVFNKSTAPVLASFQDAYWEAKCHHLMFADCGEGTSSGTTLKRTFEMSNTWFQFQKDGNNNVTLQFYFRSFINNGSGSYSPAPVSPGVSLSSNSGAISIYRYNASGQLQSTTTKYVYQLTKKTGSAPDLFTKQILGLDGVIYDTAYMIEASFSNIQAGDYFMVKIFTPDNSTQFT